MYLPSSQYNRQTEELAWLANLNGTKKKWFRTIADHLGALKKLTYKYLEVQPLYIFS